MKTSYGFKKKKIFLQKPWQLKAPSQYCMTGGIKEQNYWEHRRCETDIKKYRADQKSKLKLLRHSKPYDLEALQIMFTII